MTPDLSTPASFCAPIPKQMGLIFQAWLETSERIGSKEVLTRV